MTELSDDADAKPVATQEEKVAYANTIVAAKPTLTPIEFHKQMRAKFGTSLPPKFYAEARRSLGITPKSSSKAKAAPNMAKKATKKAGAKRRGRPRKTAATTKPNATTAPTGGRRGRRGGPRGIRPDSLKRIEKAVDYLKKNPSGNTLADIGERFRLTSPEHRKKAFEMAGLPIPTRGGPRKRSAKATTKPVTGTGRRRGRPRRIVDPTALPSMADLAGPTPSLPVVTGRGRVAKAKVDDSLFLLMTNNGRFVGSYRTQEEALMAGMEELARGNRTGYDSLVLYQRWFEISR